MKKVYAKAAKSAIYVGSTTRVTASFNPKSPSNKNATFKSSKTSVATVSSYGTVAGKKAGTAYITVASCQHQARHRC